MHVKYNCLTAFTDKSYSDFIKLNIWYNAFMTLLILISIYFLKFNFLFNQISSHLVFNLDFISVELDKIIKFINFFFVFSKWINSDLKSLN